MRVGHKYVDGGHTHVDASTDEFGATMAYGRRYRSREDFLASHDERWVRELHDVLRELLDPGRTVLGVGSGEGEHEVLLHLAGYEVVASEVVPGALDEAARLFEGFETTLFDVFDPRPVDCDDVLVTGMDSYFDDADARRMLRSLHDVVAPSGRLIFTLRYRDNAATWAIDRLALPAMAGLNRVRGRKVARKEHGFRRSVGEISDLARKAGFHVGRVRHAAFAMEVGRFAPIPERLVALDKRLRVLNSAVVLELLT